MKVLKASFTLKSGYGKITQRKFRCVFCNKELELLARFSYYILGDVFKNYIKSFVMCKKCGDKLCAKIYNLKGKINVAPSV